MITAVHARDTDDELRQKRERERQEQSNRRGFTPTFGIHTSGHFRPPEMQRAQKPHHRATDHDEVKMRDHEIGVMQVNVTRHARQMQTGQAANGEQADKAQRI